MGWKKGPTKVRVEFTAHTDLLRSGHGFYLAPLCGEKITERFYTKYSYTVRISTLGSTNILRETRWDGVPKSYATNQKGGVTQ